VPKILAVELDKFEGKPTQTAVISGIFASRASAIEVYLADTTNIVVGDIPSPCSHRVPCLDSDLHVDGSRGMKTGDVFLW
jgi:hypothetical protein